VFYSLCIEVGYFLKAFESKANVIKYYIIFSICDQYVPTLTSLTSYNSKCTRINFGCCCKFSVDEINVYVLPRLMKTSNEVLWHQD